MPGRYWVDSLYLDHVPELARENVGRAPLCLVVHYLPSLVRYGSVPPRSGLFGSGQAVMSHDRTGVHFGASEPRQTVPPFRKRRRSSIRRRGERVSTRA